jgi:hypothetical protein
MWRDLAWILDMLQASRKALVYGHGLSNEEFQASGLHQDAILRQRTIVGEAAKRVSVESFVAAIPRFHGGKSQGSAMLSCTTMSGWTCKKCGASSRKISLH